MALSGPVAPLAIDSLRQGHGDKWLGPRPDARPPEYFGYPLWQNMHS